MPTHVTGLVFDGTTYHTGSTSGGRCSITFDEHIGPYTWQILDAYAAHSMRGTFFTVGREMVAQRVKARATLDDGHEVGDHTWSHPDLTALADHGHNQLLFTKAYMQSSTYLGFTPGTMRPPFGKLDSSVVSASNALSLAVVKWSHAANIFERDSSRIVSDIVATTVPGSIVCMHQIAAHAAAIDGILAGIAANGLTSVPVCELLGGTLA